MQSRILCGHPKYGQFEELIENYEAHGKKEIMKWSHDIIKFLSQFVQVCLEDLNLSHIKLNSHRQVMVDLCAQSKKYSLWKATEETKR